MDIEKPQKVVREIVTNVEEEEESLVEERSKLERAVMTRLASPSLQQLEAALQENRSLLLQEPHELFDVIQKTADSICRVHVSHVHVHIIIHFYSCLHVYVSPPPPPTMSGSNVKCGRMFSCSWHRLPSSGTPPIFPQPYHQTNSLCSMWLLTSHVS